MPKHPPREFRSHWIIIVLILLTAFVFRFQDIGSTPAGLHPAEVVNVQDAIVAIESHDRQVFYTGSSDTPDGREGLFINLQSYVVDWFGVELWTIRLVSAIAGLLTVLGLYKLATILFNWQIGAISSFLLATSFWHVLFSRLGFRAILAPLFLVWAFYYFWRGRQTHRLWHYALSGAMWGLGILSYSGFPIMIIVLVMVMVTYWIALHKDFRGKKNQHLHDQVLRGYTIMLGVAVLISAPLLIHFYVAPDLWLANFSDIPTSAVSNHSTSIVGTFQATFDMLFGTGVTTLTHGIPGLSLVFWPVTIFFLFGFTRSIIKLANLHKKHGHFSTVRVLLFSWLVIGIIPSLWGGGIPNATAALLIAPVIFIYAAKGLWWLYEFLHHWHHVRDKHEVALHEFHMSEGAFLGSIVIIVFLIAVMLSSYHMYFDVWALHPDLSTVFHGTL